MVMVTTKLLPFLFVLLIIFAITGICIHYRFLSLLKEKLPEKWKALGCPTLIINNSIKNNIAILKFLKDKEYLKINNPELIRVAQLLWNISRIYIVLFITTALLFIINLKN